VVSGIDDDSDDDDVFDDAEQEDLNILMEQEGETATIGKVSRPERPKDQEEILKTTLRVRRCGLCHEPGHDKRTCPLQQYLTTEEHLVEWKVFLSKWH